jgi:hypothetical protein
MNGNNGQNSFERYLLAEYQNIAEAHFRTIGAISAFFRYYLLIAALPITLLGVLIGFTSAQYLPLSLQTLFTFWPIFSVTFLIVALVGFLVLLYIVNLRMDVLLYARTVNGIRKYFYDRGEIDIDTALRTRVLPQSPLLPSYTEKAYFMPVVLAFACFDAFYFGLAIVMPRLGELSQSHLSLSSIVQLPHYLLFVILAFLAFLILHPISYFLYSHYREHAYLRSYSLGVDIDGVLNCHGEHFCKLLWENCHIRLKPNAIKVIPVHENPRLGISRANEKQVFNDPRYWTDMPALPTASEELGRMQNAFRLKTYIFTYRPWPAQVDKEAYRAWIKAANDMLSKYPYSPPRLSRLRCLRGVFRFVTRVRLEHGKWRLGLSPLEVITRCWLEKNVFRYDHITIEPGSDYLSDPKAEVKNRFYISRKKKIRFFVEDDSDKASKLAYVCDIVFLLKQPYNTSRDLPNNVIRVDSWEDLYRSVRGLS